MSSTPARADRRSVVLAVSIVALVLAVTTACATANGMHRGRQAELAQDYDRAVVEYTNIARANPANTEARTALGRARLRAAQDHAVRARRLAGLERYDEAVLEYQIAAELNPTDSQVDAALREARQKLRTKLAITRAGRTELESLIDKTRELPAPGLELPEGIKLPASLVFGNTATSRAVFLAVGKFANISTIFDPAFRDQPLSIDLHNATLGDALAALTASTHTFYRVTAPKTITIIPDTPAKRREYEESIIQTIFLSNADVKETIDLLRIVVDIRQISPISATNSISIKDTPERVAAAVKLITAIDKARPEVVIEVELLEVARTKLHEYGLQIASPGSPGISGSADVNRADFRLPNLTNLTAADVFLSGLPGLYYRLLKNDQATRTLASPHLRTADGMTASARFGEEVPVPITTFAPIAAGGINTQPITSYTYRNVGVNIDITPRLHHDDEVSLAVKVTLSSLGTSPGFGGLPTFGNREIATTIRLKDGETNMLAGLIRDEDRSVLSGVPGLSDVPILGRLFANTRHETLQTDIILTLTPHVVRVLDLTEADLRPFRLGREAATGSLSEILGAPAATPKDEPSDAREGTQPPRPGPIFGVPPPAAPPASFPQPLQGTLPGTMMPMQTPPAPKKPGGGGGTGER
jgi:general secretion pathway protein D